MMIVVAIAVYELAAFCLFLLVLNRFIFGIPDSPRKTGLAVAIVLAMGIAAVSAAVFLPPCPWLGVPFAILALIAIGEVRRALFRHRYHGSDPIGSVAHDVPLTRPITTTHLVAHRYRLPLSAWQGDPLRIVHLSDLHVHAGLGRTYFEAALDAAEEERPDLVFFTGDFVSNVKSIPLLEQVIRPIGTHGCFAVLGNHDYWVDAQRVRAALAGKRIQLLTNESVVQRIGDRELTITGCDDPWGETRFEAPPDPGDGLHLVLSHTPDNIYRLARIPVDCVFSGHLHAGQVRVPFIGSMAVPSAYGRRFDHGHFVVRDTHLFVASGVGTSGPLFRIYCQPDIFVVDVVPDPNSAP